MNTKLLNTIENDLRINRFIDELESDYYQRIIYSVGASWAKTLVFGNSYSDDKSDDDFVNTDIMYIEVHLSKVLLSFLKSFDIDSKWLGYEDEFDYISQARVLASHIVDEVIYSYNLAKVNSRRITPVESSLIKYSDNIFLVKGHLFKEKNVFSVGVSQWKIDENINNYFVDSKIIEVLGKDYYKVMNDEFIWKKSNLKGNYLVFKTGSKGAYSRCWKPIDIKKINQNINILKNPDEFNGGYFLIKKINNELYVSDLDPWYIEKKEIYRILYSLNYNNGTPAEFRIEKRIDHVLIRFSSALPEHENRLIKSCSWPYMNYDNKYFRIVPKFLWEIVEKQLCNMGIKLVE